MAHPDRDFLIGRRLLLAAVPAFFAAPALANLGPELAKGTLARFVLAKAPKPLPDLAFTDAEDKPVSLAAYKGKTVLLNFWATWCAPCVKEMPSLAKLQAAVPGLKVLAVDVEKKKPEDAAAFLKSHQADTLGVYVDTELALLHTFGAYGLPTTVLVDPKGNAIAKAQGPAEWNAPEFVAYFKSLAAS